MEEVLLAITGGDEPEALVNPKPLSLIFRLIVPLAVAISSPRVTAFDAAPLYVNTIETVWARGLCGTAQTFGASTRMLDPSLARFRQSCAENARFRPGGQGRHGRTSGRLW
jgi:hypothetical protein